MTNQTNKYYVPRSTYYQPTISQCEKHDIASFEVWEHKENGMVDFPDIPEEDWVEYHDDDIVEPEYND